MSTPLVITNIRDLLICYPFLTYRDDKDKIMWKDLVKEASPPRQKNALNCNYEELFLRMQEELQMIIPIRNHIVNGIRLGLKKSQIFDQQAELWFGRKFSRGNLSPSTERLYKIYHFEAGTEAQKRNTKMELTEVELDMLQCLSES